MSRTYRTILSKEAMQTTGGYSSWINGKVEQHNQSINAMTRTALYDSDLQKSLWCFALESMVNTYNARVHSATSEQPDFDFYGIRRSIHDLCIWGCSIEKKNPTTQQTTSQSISGYFMGLTHTKAIIKYWDPTHPRQIKYATSASFYENNFFLIQMNFLQVLN